MKIVFMKLNPVFLKKYFNMLSTESFTQHAKR